MHPKAFGGVRTALPFALLVFVAACPKSGNVDRPSTDGGSAIVQTGSTPTTNACQGAASACIYGSVVSDGFTGPLLFGRVYLFSVFPGGTVQPLPLADSGDGGDELALDSTFAFSNLDPKTHYYVRAVTRFDAGDPQANVETVIGPIAVPTSGPIQLVVHPVSLEVLQETIANATTLQWASARVFDPSNGHEITDATVTFHAGSESWPLTYGRGPLNIGSYWAFLPANTPGGTSFSFDTEQASIGKATWQVTGELPTFDATITAPKDGASITQGSDLAVSWQTAPGATYTDVALYALVDSDGGKQYVSKYASPAPLEPETTTATIPGASISGPGAYLVNVTPGKATCPLTAQGCVQNTVSASVKLTAQ